MAAAAYKMISIPEAQDIVLSHTRPLGAVTVGLAGALGRVLAEEVRAPDSLPPFPASIKDGYAVVAADGVGEFPVVGESRAGHLDQLPVAPGSVAYITTGAPVPPGADAVVQVEDTEKLPDGEGSQRRVRICKAAKAGQDIRPVGSDITEGDTVLQAGERVGVAEMGILATVGAVSLKVHATPRVAVLSTGDEVVDPSTAPLGPGQIRDANRAMLLAAAAKAGAEVVDMGVARDTEGHLEGCLAAAIEQRVDVLITSGGVSMGDRDLIKPLLAREGTIHFGRVRMKPGKPLTFATLTLPQQGGRQMLVFGLPGNPVSSFVCFHLVVLPALRKMGGWAEPQLRRVAARLAVDIKLDPERPEYHRCTLQWGPPPLGSTPALKAAVAEAAAAQDPLHAPPPPPPHEASAHGAAGLGSMELWAVSTGNQISSRLLSARSANALLEIPCASGVIKAGSLVSALLIDDLGGMPVPPGGVPVTPGF
ncbi:hypothetical protein CHLRE_10g451400v5 [Chlamydomonas reinhardtii]|uniref:Molybdopterin biosynthesis protein CNX1 n=1 Tax=Chlamydomonas reinhardtii TaxID=3055 RepID=A0A2K3DB71_CHLRE|nr:uncharacterized protein CHLRE_10g451400v5 [Chlamydomonas reinhardtii]PNW77779.1 hypothetical protein CHLRE_10g451400v5 [Chlamydomonas reinhardtii]